jgi:hypothetical protein
MAIAVAPAESVDPATMLTGDVTVALTLGVQIVTDGFAGFKAQGAAKAEPAKKINVRSRQRRNPKLQQGIAIPHPQFDPSTPLRKVWNFGQIVERCRN